MHDLLPELLAMPDQWRTAPALLYCQKIGDWFHVADDASIALPTQDGDSRTVTLGLVNVHYLPDTPAHPARIFDACVVRLNELQQEWQTAYFLAIDQGLKLQNLYLLGSAAECLGQICKFALSDAMEFDPQPVAQEAVFIAIKDSLRNPCSGAWPKTVTVAKTAVAANDGHMGEIA